MIQPISADYDQLVRIPADLGGGTIDGSYSFTREPIKTVLDPVYEPKPIEPVSYDPAIDLSGVKDLFDSPMYSPEIITEEPVLVKEPVITREPVKTVLDPVYKPEPVYQEPAKVTAPIQTTAPIVSAKITKTVRILDDQGTPVPGVHVFFDQNAGTTTNFNGQATITGEDGSRKVFITHVGFEPQSFALKDLPASVKLIPGESLNEVIVDAPAKAAATDSKVPKYLFPAIGGVALLLILMSMGKSKPKKVTL